MSEMRGISDKEMKKYAKKISRDLKYASKAAKRYFPEGVKLFDDSVIEKLCDDEYKAEVALRAALDSMKKAKENGEDAAVHKNAVAVCRKNYNDAKAKVKAANKENALCYSAVKPWLDAVKTIKQSENYADTDVLCQTTV